MKDPKRNGGKSLAQIVEHNAHDKLGRRGAGIPGSDREPAPGIAGAVRRHRRRVGRDRGRVPERGGEAMSITIRVNGTERQLDVDPEMPLLVGAARRARPDRHQVRLRPGALRRLHGAPQRPGRALLRDARSPRGGRERGDDRGAVAGRQSPAAEGLGRTRRAPVRLLPGRAADDRVGAPQRSIRGPPTSRSTSRWLATSAVAARTAASARRSRRRPESDSERSDQLLDSATVVPACVEPRGGRRRARLLLPVDAQRPTNEPGKPPSRSP